MQRAKLGQSPGYVVVEVVVVAEGDEVVAHVVVAMVEAGMMMSNVTVVGSMGICPEIVEVEVVAEVVEEVVEGQSILD